MNRMEIGRRAFLEKTVVAGAALAGLACRKIHAQPRSLPSLKNKSVLLVWGGWQGHEPRQCNDMLDTWMKAQGATTVVSDTLAVYGDLATLTSYDLIIHSWTQAKDYNSKYIDNLLQAVKRGVGLAGWHGGLGDSFRDHVEYQFMVGGQWVAHPGGIIDYEVNITDHTDPVTQGLEDFNMHSEQYYMHVDPNVHVLATTTFSADHAFWINGCTMPVIWKKYFGKGRVFYSALGHVVKDFEVPEAWEVLKRGICWAGESKTGPQEKWISPVYPAG